MSLILNMQQKLSGQLMNVFLYFRRDVHAVCLWDDKGPAKIHQALKEDILDFIKQAQAVRVGESLIAFCIIVV